MVEDASDDGKIMTRAELSGLKRHEFFASRGESFAGIRNPLWSDCLII